MDGLFGDPARARRLERALLAAPGVRRARASSETGRVLVELAGSAWEEDDIRAAVKAEADPLGAVPPSVGRLVRRAARKAVNAALSAVAEIRKARRAQPGQQAEDARSAGDAHARPAHEVAAELDVDPTTGLSRSEAERRARELGPNMFAGIESRSAAAMLAGQVLTVPNAVLFSAAGASALLGEAIEAVAIGAVMATNVAIGYFTERRAEELLHAWGELHAGRARVRRDGREPTIDAATVVPGDILLLRAGEAVAADARVLEADDLTADESTLTGESEPAEKDPRPSPPDAPVADRCSMVFAGTEIASGSGAAVVVATGDRTELGAVRRALAAGSDRSAPLERKLDALGKRLAGLAFLAAGAIVPIGLIRGQALRELVLGAVALGVAAIPEGIPTAGTTALALASRKLFRRGIIIRRLASAETLGAVTAVCADKTGTLTLNRMRVEQIYLPVGGTVRVAWTEGGTRFELHRTNGDAPDPRAVRDLTRVLSLNADVEITEEGEIRGSGTERALVELALGAGFPVTRARRRARRVGEQRRSAERAFMITAHDDPELGRFELVKGAPEQVLELCRLEGGDTEPMRRNEAMASRGLRVLACAWRHQDDGDGPFVFLGLVGLRDPPRPGVREALSALSRAGVRTYMLTGDQERTAKAVAASLGIDPDAVYARVTPEAKVDVVHGLQARGHVVAMSGDGVNDAPAMVGADVSIAMGQRGTDVARAVADVVLARDELSAIAEAVGEGRRLHDNVQRAIDYLVATNMSEVAVMLVGSLLGSSPLTPIQLLWLNMLTDVVPALALTAEPAEPDIMQRPPRDPEAPLFGHDDVRRLGKMAAEMAAASLGAYAVGLSERRAAAPAMGFTSLATAQLLHTWTCRARGREASPWLRRAVTGGFALQLGALASRSARKALGVGTTSALSLALAAAIGAAPSLRRARGLRRPEEIVVEAEDNARAAA